METTKWNLINLLTFESWLAYLTTIIIVIFSLKLSYHFGQKLDLKTFTEEIALVPFRCLYFCDLFMDIIFFYRISITENSQWNNKTSNPFTKGSSSNMIFIVWALFGGIMM